MGPPEKGWAPIGFVSGSFCGDHEVASAGTLACAPFPTGVPSSLLSSALQDAQPRPSLHEHMWHVKAGLLESLSRGFWSLGNRTSSCYLGRRQEQESTLAVPRERDGEWARPGSCSPQELRSHMWEQFTSVIMKALRHTVLVDQRRGGFRKNDTGAWD